MTDFSKACYIHIPKTAGRTIRTSCPGLFIPPKTRGRIHNHFTYEEYDHSLYDYYFASIRKPEEWLQSYYYFTGFHAPFGKKNAFIRRFKSFDEWILKDGFYLLEKNYKCLTQSDWVKNIDKDNLLRVEFLQEDLDYFCVKYNIEKIILNTIGVNNLRNRSEKIQEETLKKIKKVFQKDYNLYEEVSMLRSK